MGHLVDQLFVFEGDGIISLFNGNYSDYRDWVDEQEMVKTIQVARPVPVVEEKFLSSDKKKVSYKEKQEYEKLQQEIELLEKKKEEITALLVDNTTDHQQLQKWSQEIQKLTSMVEEKTMRWLELSEIVE